MHSVLSPEILIEMLRDLFKKISGLGLKLCPDVLLKISNGFKLTNVETLSWTAVSGLAGLKHHHHPSTPSTYLHEGQLKSMYYQCDMTHIVSTMYDTYKFECGLQKLNCQHFILATVGCWSPSLQESMSFSVKAKYIKQSPSSSDRTTLEIYKSDSFAYFNVYILLLQQDISLHKLIFLRTNRSTCPLVFLRGLILATQCSINSNLLYRKCPRWENWGTESEHLRCHSQIRKRTQREEIK